MVGKTRIDDLGIGIYEAGYTAPAPGEYKVHVQLVDVASKSAAVEVRGSPFRITCSDPWTSHRVMGTVPTRNPVLHPSISPVSMLACAGDQRISAITCLLF